jgi:hypothetical protein
MNWLSEG